MLGTQFSMWAVELFVFVRNSIAYLNYRARVLSFTLVFHFDVKNEISVHVTSNAEVQDDITASRASDFEGLWQLTYVLTVVLQVVEIEGIWEGVVQVVQVCSLNISNSEKLGALRDLF